MDFGWGAIYKKWSMNSLQARSLVAAVLLACGLGVGLIAGELAGADPAAPSPVRAESSAGAPQGADSSTVAVLGEYDPKLVEALAAEAQQQGDVGRGLAVFSAARFACLSCHQVGATGGTVGPGLGDVGVRVAPAAVVESLLWPKRQVRPEFSAWQFALDDGRTLQGYRRSETADAIEIFEPGTQKTTAVPRKEIESMREVGSLMPDALTAAMTAEQRRDLVRFLCELGRDPSLPDKVHGENVPATFVFERGPVDPSQHPLWQLPVNRDRLYDFYLKQAIFFRQENCRPHLLMAFPGLDGGSYGHWGNQNEATWMDNRWNQVDLGSLLCGVVHAPGRDIPKGVCVRLGEHGEMAACFNPLTLCYEALWQDGFLKFGDTRHGFMDGLRPQGKMLPAPAGERPKEPFVYHGYYRAGPRVVFAYRIGDQELLDAPWCVDGKFERVVAAVDVHPLKELIRGAAPQWPQEIAVVGQLGETSTAAPPYVIDTIPLPLENPWKALCFFGGHDFLPDGSAVICSMTGDVWRVTGLDAELKDVRWRRIAAGLHQALGLVIDQDQIYLLGRDQITRLHDLNGDGEIDFYECVSNAMETSSGGHDFICGLERDRSGDFITASSKQGILRIKPGMDKPEILATGLRNPDGVGLTEDGCITAPNSEGDWTATSMICQIKPNAGGSAAPHFGWGGPRGGQRPAPPLVYLPRGVDNSSAGQITVSGDRWGPLAGQLIHFSFGYGSHFLVLRDEGSERTQGAVVPLPGDFRSGAHRGRFSPRDGQLYVTGMNGWGCYTPDDGCFQRVRYTGAAVQLPIGLHVYENGVMLRFTQNVDPQKLAERRNHFAQAWNYRYSGAYGSPELSPSHPLTIGHDTLDITGVVAIDSHTVFVELPDLQPVNQLQLVLQVDAGKPQEILATVHTLDKPFTKYPGYREMPKTIAAHPQAIDMELLKPGLPNPWRARQDFQATLEIAAGSNLTFSARTLKVKAGSRTRLVFKNPDGVPHNWALVERGKLAEIGDAINRLIADPEAVRRQYVPQSPCVLCYTDITQPDQQSVIYFTAPTEPGRYPYLCTFPGHWMVMNGELIVE